MPDEPDQTHGDVEEVLAVRLTTPRDTLPADPRAQITDPHFPMVLRGYDRGAVDAYVERVTGLMSELYASRSPREAVRQALERVGEETKDILRGAHDAAEQVTSSAQAEADELRTRTQAETEDLRARTQAETEDLRARTQAEAEALTTRSHADAEALERTSREEADARIEAAERQAEATLASTKQRLVDLDREVDSVWQERQRLIEDVQRISRDLGVVAAEAEERFPAEPLPETEVLPEPGALPDTEPLLDVDPDATAEIPAAELPDGEDPQP